MNQNPQTAPREDELAERLRGAIRQGDILNDGRMPPERALAEHFGVSRARLRLALGLLPSPLTGSARKRLSAWIS